MHAYAVYIWNYLDISIIIYIPYIPRNIPIIHHCPPKNYEIAICRARFHSATSPSQVCNAYTWRRRRLGMLKEVCQTWLENPINK